MNRDDILRFIDSRELRDRLEKENYQFSSLEAAWLIHECKEATVEEKHRAWKDLIETMPDCSVPRIYIFGPQLDSLHAFLNRYMELEDRYIEEFYDDHHGDTYDDPKPYVYRFRYVNKDGSFFEYPTVFSMFSALYETIMEPGENTVRIECEKMQIDRLHSQVFCDLTPDLDVLEIDPWEIDDKEESAVFGTFDVLSSEILASIKKENEELEKKEQI